MAGLRVLFVTALLGFTVGMSLPLPRPAPAYTPHAEIFIDGNADFTAANGVTAGTGSPSDPFVLEGWDINVSGVIGIEIRNTDAYFSIRSAYLHGGPPEAIRLYNVTHGLVENMTVAKTGVGVLLDRSREVEVSASHIAAQTGIFATMSNNVTLAGNQIVLPGYQSGVGIRLVSTVRDIAVLNNTIGTGYVGIDVQDLERGLIQGNTLEGSEGNVWLRYSKEVVVSDNRITGGWTGISTQGGQGNVYEGNVVRGSTYGIYFHEFTTGNVIRLNRIEGSPNGVRFFQATANLVYHNEFLGSPASTWPDPDVWDDGYPSGGNYWDSYAGVDNCSGPLQDVCPDPDGIGDTPRVIDASNRDRYPLMNPVAPVMMSATLAGPSLQDLTLAWTTSPVERMGTEYRVLHSADLLGPYAEIAAVPADGSAVYSYACPGCGHIPGDLNSSFFVVRALTNGSATPPSNVGARVSMPVRIGANLLTVPVLPVNTSVPFVLQTVSFDTVRTYRGGDAVDPWKAYHAGRAGDLASLQRGDAFWANATADGQYTLAGLVEENPSVPLLAGWNLVAYSAFRSETRDASLAGVTGVVRVETWDETSADPYALRAVVGSELLLPGRAYWIQVLAAGSWVQG